MVGVSGCWPFVRFGGSTNVKCKTQAGHWRLNELLYLACVGLAVPPWLTYFHRVGMSGPPPGNMGWMGWIFLVLDFLHFFFGRLLLV
jgi:hypothetical protein